MGTREEHLNDLHRLWSFGLAIETEGLYHTQEQIERANRLQVALDLLTYHMMSDYIQTPYAQEINKLPDPWKWNKD